MPRTTTSYSRLLMVTDVAVVPVSSERTAEPMVEAVRPYCEAASRSMLISTCGTCSDSELATSTASGRADMRSTRSSAIMARVL